MSDPAFTPIDYILAHDVVRSVGENLAIQFQLEGSNWDRDMMQAHINSRAAILKVQEILLREGERLVRNSTAGQE